MEELFEGAVSFALSALRKSMLVLTRRQKEALKNVISRKDMFVSLVPFHATGRLQDGLAGQTRSIAYASLVKRLPGTRG